MLDEAVTCHNFEKGYPTVKVSFSATFGKERVNDNCAMCFSLTISEANTSVAVDARPNTVRICTGHRRGNRPFGFQNASCPALGAKGYSADWLQVKFCTKCVFHGCCWFCLCQIREIRTFLLQGCHFQIWWNLAPAATTNTMQFAWNKPLKVFLSTDLGMKVYVRRICCVCHCECVKFFCGHSVGASQRVRTSERNTLFQPWYKCQIRMSDDHDNEDNNNNNNTLLILGLVHDPSPFYQTINTELPLCYTHIK